MIKSVLIALFLGTGICAARQKNDFSSYRIYSDSVLKAHTGTEVFERFIALDSSASSYLGRSENHKASFRSQPSFDPDRFRFHYWFYHPKIKEKFPIVFTIDKNYRFVEDPTTHGLIDMHGLHDSTIVSRKQAIRMCRGQAFSLRKKTAKLVWYDKNLNFDFYRKTNNLDALWSGRLTWAIKGKIDFRGTIYSGTFYVDVLTGRIIRGFAVPWD